MKLIVIKDRQILFATVILPKKKTYLGNHKSEAAYSNVTTAKAPSKNTYVIVHISCTIYPIT